jgi:hypothetical protein
MNDEEIRKIAASQFRAALKTMRLAVEASPQDFWIDAPPNLSAPWRVAHHTVWFADLYLSKDEAAFTNWPKHVDDHQHIGPYRDFDSDEPPRIGTPTSRAEMIEFIDYVDAKIESSLAVPLDGPSGFSWLKFSALEKHLYNARHIQHHAAQLVGRLRERGIEVKWVGKA